MASIWKGTTGATLQKRMEKRTSLDVGATITTVQLTFVGKLSDLQTAAAGTYLPGGAIGNGYGGDIIIKESEVAGAGNVDAATLTVTGDNASATGGGGGGGGGGSTTVYELEWVLREFPIENLNGKINNTGSTYNFLGMSKEDKLAVKKVYDSGTGTVTGDTKIALLKAKLDGYLTFQKYLPVMRMTSSSLFRPTTGGCGTVQSPSAGGVPSTYYPSGYNYVKSADRALKQRNQWVRNQEWTGEVD